jgi:tetratricopeptide (TPR) repeat protein
MALSEIEKLERRYAENPHGLTFAPLAEVHRKNGDVQRALELLRPGLQDHPDYIPASIVLGRCHLDLGDLPAAESAFTHVLALDGENVIALKALADINERLHRFDDAERWLKTLLSLDRSNDEARDQLARLELARRQTAAGSAAAGAEATPLEIGSEPDVASPAEPAIAVEEPAAAWASQADAPGASGARPLVPDELEPARVADLDAPPAGLEREEPVLDEDAVEPMPDLVGREVDFADPAAGEFRVETSEEIILESAGGGEFQVPDASQELFSRAPDTSPFGETVPPTVHPPEPEPTPTGPVGEESSALDFAPVLVEAAGMVPPREDEKEEAPEAGRELEALAEFEPGPPPSLDGSLVPEPLVSLEAEPVSGPADLGPSSPVEPFEQPPALEPTETAAAPAEAEYPPVPTPPSAPEPPVPAEPLPALAPAEPEPVVTETMAEVLLQQGHAAEALGVYRELASRSGDPRHQQKVADLESAQPAPRLARYAAVDTGGRSVGDTLRAMLAARLPARPAAPPVRQPAAPGGEGAPTRPAAEALSLSSVFGEETPAAPPAVPSAPSERDRVSFDDFYGNAGPAQPPRGPRAAEPKGDDLDEFHTWLQNLKR